MIDNDSIINELRDKVDRLISLHKRTETEKKELLEEKNKLEIILKEKEFKLNSLEEKNNIVLVAKSLIKDEADSKRLKQKIRDLMRDIDKSIALLNK